MDSAKTVIDQSMTFSERLQNLGLWTFTNCHWPVNDTFGRAIGKVSLTGQWQFRSVSKILDCGLLENVIDQSMTLFEHPCEKCHWPVNDSLEASPKSWIVDFYKLSLTSQWHFLNILVKSVIDRSMTVSVGLQKVGLWTFINCHWLVNDSLGASPKSWIVDF